MNERPRSTPETSPDDPAGIKVKILAARKEEQRRASEVALAAHIALSPACVRTEPVVCTDPEVFHSPCSRCACPSFVGTPRASGGIATAPVVELQIADAVREGRRKRR